ncbi:hypothetical protein GEO21_20555 [Sphingobacterium faecium]|uniref:hypothetical protein n=1 Tax=Sphingobacterium faecium TaxID=34087 RepID=UPI001290E6FC|nr:hypothetical protein [Sphingobacterium faecium]MQP29882.1 hypothetical protein [Sphingobacterium faecium]
MNIAQLKNKSQVQKPLFASTTKKANQKKAKYTLSNKNFFTENHEYFGVTSKKYFKEYYRALDNEQRLGLWLFFRNLSSENKMDISEVRFNDDKISYVEIKTTMDKKRITFELYYMRGMHKLLSFASYTKYDLDAKELLKIASQG